jgi:5-formyltetrahydrofolate cyclo-ligase
LRTKPEWRLELKSRLASIPNSEYDRLSLKLSVNLNKFLNRLGVIQKHLSVAGFAPIEKEPQWFLSLEEGYENLLAFPAILDGKMIFKRASFKELELRSEFGVKILGPKELSLPVIPDVILVPGLSFTRKGERLGRGKGFYDRALEESSALKIGIAFSHQIERSIPTDPHDELMDFIVTEKEIIKIEKAKEF